LARKYTSTRLKNNPRVSFSVNMLQWDISIRKMNKMKNVDYEGLKSCNKACEYRRTKSTRLKNNPRVGFYINMFQWDISIRKMNKMKNVDYEGLKSCNMSWSAPNNLDDILWVTFDKKTNNTLLLNDFITFQYYNVILRFNIPLN